MNMIPQDTQKKQPSPTFSTEQCLDDYEALIDRMADQLNNLVRRVGREEATRLTAPLPEKSAR